MVLLVSCSDAEATLLQNLTLNESDHETVQKKNDLIKDLLANDDQIKEKYTMIYDHLDQITFESLTGSQSGSTGYLKGDIRWDLSGAMYVGNFIMAIEGETLQSFELVDNVLKMDKPLNLFSFDGLEDYMDIGKENKSITLEKNNKTYTYLMDELINFEVKDITYNVAEQTYIETVELYFVNSMLSSNFDVKVAFEVNTEETVMKHIDTQLSQLKITPSQNLSGRWGVPYRVEPLYTEFGVLIVNDYDGETVSYSGRMFRYNWQIKADHVNHGDVYDVTLEYNFEDESIYIVAGEKTQGLSSEPGLEFLITKISNDTLICEPANWENITKFPLSFSKEYDTIAIFNNKQVMLKTVAESEDKSTVYHD